VSRALLPLSNPFVDGQALTRDIRLGAISRELWLVCRGFRLVGTNPAGASRYSRNLAAQRGT
jgi:hypothetical protein